MTPTPQIELHPDADSLNAFVEQALAGSEREQVLAHLAACSRCRQVVYLAQEAAAPARVPAAGPAMQSRPWFKNWRFIWVPATALATALALVVAFYLERPASAPELAKAAPQSEESIARPALPEPPVVGVVHTQTPAAPAKPASRKPGLSASRAVPAESAVMGAPSAPFPAQRDASTFQNQTNNEEFPPLGSSVSGLVPQPATAQFKPEPTAPSLQIDSQRTVGGGAGNVPPAHTSAAGFRGTAVHAQASRAVSLAAAAPPIEPHPMLTNNLAIAAQGPMAQALTPRANFSIKLPSGLTAVSTATAQHHMLAIDATGALFLSEDAGLNWKPVAQQWTGRAVAVRVRRSLNASAAPAGVLELINDGGLVWVSTDGNTWTMQ
jgi:hypothetical protein